MSRKNDRDDRFFLSENSDKRRLRDAENARKNRAEIIKAHSRGKVSRRDLIKMGLITAGGALVPIGGLSPFVPSVYAHTNIPTGANPSPLFGQVPFSQPMLRFDVLPRINNPMTGGLTPTPQAQANTTQQTVDPKLGGGQGPIEGRPPGATWAHQRFTQFTPQVGYDASQAQATTNTTYNPQVPSTLNSGVNPASPIPLKFHPAFPTQNQDSVWTFNGTIPPKLVLGRYGEAILFRHHNRLPVDVAQNGPNAFGRHTISTHEHNGHHGAENDGFTGAYFFPNQFYDYHWPIVLAGHDTVNTGATDPRAGSPNGSGGINNVPGDWHETMSTHWFHDHMFSFTAQNVYKGNAAMFNIYSSLDRGNEGINDGVNLRLPSGTTFDYGNLDYDVNLMLADKAWDNNGQLYFDIFEFDGFLGDQVTVNLCWKPYFEVERRRYRFRILNASVSRFFKLALVDASGNARTIYQIANDGNLLPQVAPLTQLDEQGIAERYDIIIDFANFNLNDKLHLVNLAEHQDGTMPDADLTVAQALSGQSSDPGVGSILEFRIVRNPAKPDASRDVSIAANQTLIPNPDLSSIPITRQRTFVFDHNPNTDTNDPVTTFITGAGGQSAKWGIGTDNSGGDGSNADVLSADFGRISAAPKFGTREVWTLINARDNWDHPIHIHFEEGQILSRKDNNGNNVPILLAEQGRKDVYRLRPGGSVTITMQFRDWGGMFMEHCHNTMHEDNAMLLRWEINGALGDSQLTPLPSPIPSPQGVTFRSPDEVLSGAY